MKTIIVPTDFSTYADSALEFALEIAPKMNATVLLLHVVDLPPLIQSLYMENYGAEQIYEDAKKKAEVKLSKIRELHPGRTITSAVFQGNIAEIITEIEHRYEAKLIVMGTKGTSGLKGAFVGSNTEKVIRNARTPVISIHQETHVSEINNVVIPTNGKDVQEGFFEELKDLQKIFNFKINVLFINALHAFENEEVIKENLENYAANAKLEDYDVAIIKAVTPEDGIEEYVESNNVDMVAITTHGRHGLSHLIYGSITENLANHLHVPLFSYNMKKQKPTHTD